MIRYKHLLLPGIAAVAVIAALVVWLRTSPKTDLASETTATPNTSSAKSLSKTATTTTAKQPSSQTDAERRAAMRAQKEQRMQQLLTEIRAARAKREDQARNLAEHSGAPQPPINPSDTPITKNQIQSGMRETVLPHIIKCYESAIKTQPDLSGKLQVHFVIEGEPEIGGVVVESTVDETVGIGNHAKLSACVEGSIYALEIPEYQGEGRVEVNYPFTFSPDE